jgi:hypothetical protein
MTGSVMVSKDFYQGQNPEHPLSLVNQQLAGTYTQMEALDRLVVLSAGVLLQYQKLQAQKLWLEMRPKDRLVVLSSGEMLQYQKVQAQQLWLEMTKTRKIKRIREARGN